ncbi:ABC-three component system middle component 2 [Paraburkholderia fungorum]|uniref:ABC-three component system middle component 2 n=1 Tax=Paraburkholderia fungorum TaxID=134537 RepID=UPI00387794F1
MNIADKTIRTPQVRPFNSVLEYGFRTLFVLNAARGHGMDLARLVSYDYLLVHSGDVDAGPASLHPAMPHRGTELLVKRNVIHAGLTQMLGKELIEIDFAPQGFLYRATDMTDAFIKLLKSAYARELVARAEWIVGQFGGYSDQELETFMAQNLGRWGSEFESLTAVDSLEL